MPYSTLYTNEKHIYNYINIAGIYEPGAGYAAQYNGQQIYG